MKTTNRLSINEWEIIMQRVKNGEFYNDIAKDYGITNAAISYRKMLKGICFHSDLPKKKALINIMNIYIIMQQFT